MVTHLITIVAYYIKKIIAMDVCLNYLYLLCIRLLCNFCISSETNTVYYTREKCKIFFFLYSIQMTHWREKENDTQDSGGEAGPPRDLRSLCTQLADEANLWLIRSPYYFLQPRWRPLVLGGGYVSRHACQASFTSPCAAFETETHIVLAL